MRRAALIVIAAVVLGSGAALAQPAAQPNDPALHSYPDTDPTCVEWTDACRTCLRVGNTGSCSNIGIACQPKAITCTRREEAAKPPATK